VSGWTGGLEKADFQGFRGYQWGVGVTVIPDALTP